MTTAADILRSYRSAARHLHVPPTAWLKLLIVASHGDAGCALHSLNSIRNKASGYSFLRRMKQRGLITSCRKATRAGRPTLWVHLTPKALEALALTPPAA